MAIFDEAVAKPIPPLGYEGQKRKTNMIPRVQDEQEMPVKQVTAASTCSRANERANTGLASKLPMLQPPPHPHSIIPGEKIITKPTVPAKVTEGQVMTRSLQVYTIASLQQHTNSFSQENYIGEGTLGPVYRAELPDGKV